MTSIAADIRAAGLRATPPRITLLKFLRTIEKPLSIQAIAEQIGPSIDTVTIYRNIDSFKRADLVREIDLRQGRPLYEAEDYEHDHHHVVCTNCNKTEDFTGCNYESLAETALKQTRGFSIIESHSVELFGLCKSCA